MALYHCRQKRFLIRLIPGIAMLGVLAVCLLDKASVIAQDDRELMRDKVASMQREKRLALVIGNGLYTKASPLDNPVNDANDMAATLQKLGFEVIKGTDTNLVQMRRLIREFGEKLDRQKGVGLFYFAGHGVEVRGRNFLIPVDADIAREVETEDYAVDLSAVLRQMDAANNGFNIVILDACRNNPFARGWNRSSDTGGLANVLAPTGTFIAFAAAPGSTASDGRGTRNGIFTGALLKHLNRPNLKLEDVFKSTREEVISLTGRKQVPWDSSSIQGDFYFNYKTTGLPAGPTGRDPDPDTRSSASEASAWDLVKDSSDPRDLREFIREFPGGQNARTARSRLDDMAWTAARKTNTKESVEGYLKEYSDGINAAAARILLRQIESRPIGPAAGAVRTNNIGMELVYIPPGEFVMGSENGNAEEKPTRKVTIREGFWMGKYEVTQGQWLRVMGMTLQQQRDKADVGLSVNGEGGDYPAYYVSWEEAKEFISRLNAKNDGFIYSLPSEAQWEYAARAGTTGDRYSNLDDIAWYANNSGRMSLEAGSLENIGGIHYLARLADNRNSTRPVGGKQPNAFGLYDMLGNVWEWCDDWHHDSYSGLPTDGTANTTIGEKKYRVLRGASWGDLANFARVSYRHQSGPITRDHAFGFRVVARLPTSR